MRKALLVFLVAALPLAAEDQITKVIQAKHRPAESLAELVRHSIATTISRDFNTITLTSTPEKVKTAEAVIQQYDTPRRQAEFVIRVIEAGSAGKLPGKVAEKGGAPEGDATDAVPAELKSLLRYGQYTQRDLAVLRGMESEGMQLALGGNLIGTLNFRVRESQPALIEAHIGIRGPGTVVKRSQGEDILRPELLNTSATVKDGETVVLGASKMQGGGTALIVLLTAKLLH